MLGDVRGGGAGAAVGVGPVSPACLFRFYKGEVGGGGGRGERRREGRPGQRFVQTEVTVETYAYAYHVCIHVCVCLTSPCPPVVTVRGDRARFPRVDVTPTPSYTAVSEAPAPLSLPVSKGKSPPPPPWRRRCRRYFWLCDVLCCVSGQES